MEANLENINPKLAWLDLYDTRSYRLE